MFWDSLEIEDFKGLSHKIRLQFSPPTHHSNHPESQSKRKSKAAKRNLNEIGLFLIASRVIPNRNAFCLCWD